MSQIKNINKKRIMNDKLTFSGHETFHCRTFWLKKGYDYLRANSNNTFKNEEKAVTELGVGRNMVTSIRYWMKAFNIIDNNEKPIDDSISTLILSKFDEYLEDPASLWLLHHELIRTGKASIYNLFFNQFRKERSEFTKDQFLRFLKRICLEREEDYNSQENTITTDTNIFIRTYNRPLNVVKNIEDEFSSILLELNLLKVIRSHDDDKSVICYSIESSDRSEIPWQVILYSILMFSEENLISFNDLMAKPNSPALIFAMTASGLIKKIFEITENVKGIQFIDENGIREIHINKKIDHREFAIKTLSEYYEFN